MCGVVAAVGSVAPAMAAKTIPMGRTNQKFQWWSVPMRAKV